MEEQLRTFGCGNQGEITSACPKGAQPLQSAGCKVKVSVVLDSMKERGS